jgi:hypothetical protein
MYTFIISLLIYSFISDISTWSLILIIFNIIRYTIIWIIRFLLIHLKSYFIFCVFKSKLFLTFIKFKLIINTLIYIILLVIIKIILGAKVTVAFQTVCST